MTDNLPSASPNSDTKDQVGSSRNDSDSPFFASASDPMVRPTPFEVPSLAAPDTPPQHGADLLNSPEGSTGSAPPIVAPLDVDEGSLEALTPNQTAIVQIPLEDLEHNAAFKKFAASRSQRARRHPQKVALPVLCMQFPLCGGEGCSLGDECMNLHPRKDIKNYPVQPIHINRNVKSVKDSHHEVLPPGVRISIWNADKSLVHVLDSGLLYVTAGSRDAFRHFSNDPAGATDRVRMQHCTHYLIDRCKRGPKCNFIHVVFSETEAYPQSLLLLRGHSGKPKAPPEARHHQDAKQAQQAGWQRQQAGAQQQRPLQGQPPQYGATSPGGPQPQFIQLAPMSMQAQQYQQQFQQQQPLQPVILGAGGGYVLQQPQQQFGVLMAQQPQILTTQGQQQQPIYYVLPQQQQQQQQPQFVQAGQFFQTQQQDGTPILLQAMPQLQQGSQQQQQNQQQPWGWSQFK